MAIGLILHKNKQKKTNLFPRLESLFLFAVEYYSHGCFSEASSPQVGEKIRQGRLTTTMNTPSLTGLMQ